MDSTYKLHHLDTAMTESHGYLDCVWEYIIKLRRLRTLELEYKFAMACEEKNEFHRKVKDNDRPGHRHALPFYWSTRVGLDGVPKGLQVPIRFDSPEFHARMALYAKKIDAARKAWQLAKQAEGKEV